MNANALKAKILEVAERLRVIRGGESITEHDLREAAEALRENWQELRAKVISNQ